METVPALDRGIIDAMADERAEFAYSAGCQGFLVTAAGELGVTRPGVVQLWSVPDSLAVTMSGPWLMGKSVDGVTHCAWQVDADAFAAVPGLSFEPITVIGADLSDDEALLGAQAVALSRWHSSNSFCAKCGQAILVVEGGWATRCTGCQQVEYPRTDPAIIVLITDASDRVLLAHNTAWNSNLMSLPAGFVEAGETPRRAVVREVMEEVGLAVERIEYLGAQPWPGPRSLMLGFAARTVQEAPQIFPDGVEIDRAQFFSREEYLAALAGGTVTAPRRTAIANALLAQWLGRPLPDLD